MKSLIEKLNSKLNAQGGFLKAVSVLVGGTAFAQLLTVISLPIITRLYTPEQFSVFAIYVSMLGILGVICCLRFEIAIPIPEDKQEAISLSVLAIVSNIIFSILLCLVIFLFSKPLLTWMGKVEILDYIWWLPVGVFFTGLFTTFQYWATRQKQYNIIAKTSVVQAGVGSITQIVSGLLGYGVLGLVFGQVVKSSAGMIKLAKNFYQDCSQFIKKENFSNLKSVFKKNIQFPKYSVWDALANTASIQLPIMMIALLSTGGEAGFLMLAMQLLAIPMTFIGRAVSQVYLAEAPAKVESGEIGEFTVKVLENLLLIGISILVAIGILSPLFVKYIFGQQWAGMGVMISWMIPWFIFQLISSPISMIMHVVNKQKLLLVLTLSGLLLKTTALYVQYYVDPKYLVQNFAIVSAVFYLVAFFIFIKCANVNFFDLYKVIKKQFVIYISVVISASGLAYLLKLFGV